MGAVAFAGAIPARIEEGESGPAFPIEVFNVLGAGDGFMAGLLSGWLADADWPRALTYANACGAFAVSRHGCAPAYPSREELQFFLKRGIVTPALRDDAALEQIHWSTNRRGDWPVMRVFAFDHRAQIEVLPGATPERIGRFKELCLEACLFVARGKPGYGLLCDNRLGRSALHRAAGSGLWIGRPVEWPGSRPLELEPELGPDYGGLMEWPLDHVVKVLCFYHPDDDEAMKAQQEATVVRLFHAARRNRLEFLLEVIPSKVGPVGEKTTAAVIRRFYELGVFPDWWKLEPMTTDGAWSETCRAIEENDAHTRGIVVLGLGASEDQLGRSFAAAARHDLVKGFAVGRTIHAEAGREWLSGSIDDATAVARMSDAYSRLCAIWDRARGL
jgi:5-dehydro-2-deoxygluconokinase